MDLCKSTPSLLHYILPLFYKLILSDEVSLSSMKQYTIRVYFLLLFTKINVVELLSNTILLVWEFMLCRFDPKRSITRYIQAKRLSIKLLLCFFSPNFNFL